MESKSIQTNMKQVDQLPNFNVQAKSDADEEAVEIDNLTEGYF